MKRQKETGKQNSVNGKIALATVAEVAEAASLTRNLKNDSEPALWEDTAKFPGRLNMWSTLFDL